MWVCPELRTVQTSALKPEYLFVEIYKMEHVALFMREDARAWFAEQKKMQESFNHPENLWDVCRRTNYHDLFRKHDIAYVKTKYKEFQVLLAVCKNSKMLIDIAKK
jgi:hypothetical protein